MQTITIKLRSITDLKTDIIVNAANSRLQEGGGVCGYIFRAAGASKLQAACDRIGGCPTGSAVIIHAVGPIYVDGTNGEADLLYSCYMASLDLARDNDCRSIGFPLISSGIYGYPVEDAWTKALEAVRDWMNANQDYSIGVEFAVLDREVYQKGKTEAAKIIGNKLCVSKADWKTHDMPEEKESFRIKHCFSKSAMENLIRGHIPQDMEDRWFWYVDDGVLYLHRSWSGFCIFMLEFGPGDVHTVTVNRNKELYKSDDIHNDMRILSSILRWRSDDPYDHYGEWLQETAQALNIHVPAMKLGTLLIDGVIHDAVFFHLPNEENGFLSNWYPSSFEVDGILFSSSEQYIMYRKCMLFGDVESAEMVMKTDDPALQQDIGRKAKGYNDVVWSASRQAIALNGILEKFRQNEILRELLKATEDAVLVECAWSDKLWACGVGINSEDRMDISKWRGGNILGFTLMEVRNQLRSE